MISTVLSTRTTRGIHGPEVCEDLRGGWRNGYNLCKYEEREKRTTRPNRVGAKREAKAESRMPHSAWEAGLVKKIMQSNAGKACRALHLFKIFEGLLCV